MVQIDTKKLQNKVKEMYKAVAENPQGKFHFEMGRALAEKLGYPKADLDRIPTASTESFAGVGYHFDMADIKPGETVLDLGSGSGMDTFIAGLKTGSDGKVVGLDMTDEQLSKAEELKNQAGFSNIIFKKGYIETLPEEKEIFDVVISNGVINLSAEKEKVFQEIARVLKKGGRLAISDIVTEKQLTEKIVCDIDIWASCIGGAAQEDTYKQYIQNAGLEIKKVRKNSQYSFLSKSAQGATRDFGVKSISLLAKKE
ncbi:MAG: methyltransferase domain-containing protein [Candidatus Zambryskibacteria bacterium]|nr:methyltransferase domain-containing protein [Candidatus Zambryskibacteria bacterium]